MRIAVTTVARGAPIDVPAGWLRVFDAGAAGQIAEAPLPDAVHRAQDANARGGMRGGRGLAAAGDRMAVAVHDRIIILDTGWGVLRVISHRWMGGIHDLAADDSGLWVTSADNDLLLRVDWDGRLRHAWQWRTHAPLRRALGFGPLPGLSAWADHRDPRSLGLRLDVGHLNAVAVDGDHLLVGLGVIRRPPLVWAQAGAAMCLRAAERIGLGGQARALAEGSAASPLGRRVLAHPNVAGTRPGGNRTEGPRIVRPEWAWAVLELAQSAGGLGDPPRARVLGRHGSAGLPTHNLLAFDGFVAVNDSSTGRVLALDRETGVVVRCVQLPGELPFPRGMLRLPSGHVAVGTQSPAAVTIVDLEGEAVVDRLLLPGDRGESPYALAAVPEAFDDPAGRLPVSREDWGIAGADASAAARP